MVAAIIRIGSNVVVGNRHDGNYKLVFSLNVVQDIVAILNEGCSCNSKIKKPNSLLN